MKLGWNFVVGRELYLSSWKNKEDPAPGDFTYHCDPSGYPQNFLKKGNNVVYRSGPWNGLRFSGATSSRDSPFYTFGMFSSKTKVYFSYKLLSSVITRLILNHNGDLQRWTWGDRRQDLSPYLTIPTDNCDVYKLYGAYGSCNSVNSPVCGCLDKFVPKHNESCLQVQCITLQCHLENAYFLDQETDCTRNSFSSKIFNACRGIVRHDMQIAMYLLPYLVPNAVCDDMREHVVWALGNVAGDSLKCRDLVLSCGGLVPLLSQLNPNAKLPTLRNATWTLSIFCRGKPQPAFDQTRPALPALRQLIHLTDEKVLTDACCAFSHLSDGTNDKIQAVIDSGVCSRLCQKHYQVTAKVSGERV